MNAWSPTQSILQERESDGKGERSSMEIGVRVVAVLKLAIQCPLVHNSLFLVLSLPLKSYRYLVDQCNSSSILINPFLLQTRIGWTSTVQIKKGTRPFPGLIEPVRDTFVYEQYSYA